MKKEKNYLVKCYVLEEYYVTAKSRKDAISKTNMEGNPAKVTTIKQTAKLLKNG